MIDTALDEVFEKGIDMIVSATTRGDIEQVNKYATETKAKIQALIQAERAYAIKSYKKILKQEAKLKDAN